MAKNAALCAIIEELSRKSQARLEVPDALMCDKHQTKEAFKCGYFH
jgi:hypothetical protein